MNQIDNEKYIAEINDVIEHLSLQRGNPDTEKLAALMIAWGISLAFRQLDGSMVSMAKANAVVKLGLNTGAEKASEYIRRAMGDDDEEEESDGD